MNNNRPLIATITLSIILHSVIVVTFVLAQGSMQDTIVASSMIPEKYLQIELSFSKAIPEKIVARKTEGLKIETAAKTQKQSQNQSILSVPEKLSVTMNNDVLIQNPDTYSLDPNSHVTKGDSTKSERSKSNESESETLPNRIVALSVHKEQPSTEAFEKEFSQNKKGNDVTFSIDKKAVIHQEESIVELLHAKIGEKKEYPYIARRQRREGVATVGFVLHPDGSIKNTHLVLSSNVRTLDRAALSAVKRIEPFRPAEQYLEQAKAFKVDVVFELL